MSDVKLVVEAVLEDGGSGLTQAIEENAKRASAAAERETKRAAEKERRENEKTEREARREKEKTQREARREQEKTAREQRRLYEENAKYELEVARDVGRARAEIEQRLNSLRQQKQRDEVNDQVRRTREMEKDAERLRRNAERLDRETARNASERSRRDQEARLRAVNEGVRKEKEALREVTREREKQDRDAAKAKAAIDRKLKEDLNRQNVRNEISLRRVGSDTMTYASRLGRGALGVAGDLARGAGMDVSLQGAFQRRFDLNKAATGIATNYFDPTATREGFGSREEMRATLGGQAQSIGAAFGINPGDVLAAAEGFLKLHGNAQDASAALLLIAKTAVATNSSLGDMGELFGGLMALGGKGTSVNDVDKLVMHYGGQGRAGAVELKNFMRENPKLGAVAGAFTPRADLLQEFGGNRVFANLAQLGAMSQVVRSKTRATPTQAVQSVASFMDGMAFGPMHNALVNHGVRVFDTDKKTGRRTLRNPMEVIEDALSRAKGDPSKLPEEIRLKLGLATARAFSEAYNTGYTGESSRKPGARDKAGRAGVRALFNDAISHPMTAAGREEEVGFATGTAEAKSQQMQQRLDKIIGDLGDNLLPKLNDEIPKLSAHVQTFANTVSWASDHMGAAVGAGIVASFGAAGLSEVFRRMVAASVDATVMKMGAGKASMFAGMVLAGVTLVANTVSIIKRVENDRAVTADSIRQESEDSLQLISRVAGKAHNGMATPAERVAAQEAYKHLMATINQAGKLRKEGFGDDDFYHGVGVQARTLLSNILGDDITGVDKLGANTALAQGSTELERTGAMLVQLMDMVNNPQSPALRQNEFGPQAPPGWVPPEQRDELGRSAGNALYVQVVNSPDGSGGGNGRKRDQ